MDWAARLRATALSTVVRDTPEQFWTDARAGVRQEYLALFHEIAADPNVIAEQRIDKLYQDRHFRLESLFLSIAKKHGFSASTTILATNNRCHVYAVRGALGLTQAYVQTIGALPQAARYRERYAELIGIPKQRRFDFGDEPEPVLIGKDFYGVITHNPVGRRFTEADQRLGMMQLCIPVHDCSEWAVELPVDVILAAYERSGPSMPAPSARDPKWKRPPRKESEDGDGKA